MKRPSFQFYPTDWLSEPNIMVMTPAEEGAYIRLLCYCWDNDGLPEDDQELMILSRLGEGWLKGGSTKVLRCFYKKDGKWRNRRLDREKEKQDQWIRKSSEGGKKSAEKRWKHSEIKNKGGYNLLTTVVSPNGNTPSPSPSPSPSPPTSLKRSSKKCEGSDDFERFWNLYPNKKAKPKAWMSFRNLTSIEIASLMEALPRHIGSDQWQKDNGQFIPHPTTWINQRRWEDEIGTNQPDDKIII